MKKWLKRIGLGAAAVLAVLIGGCCFLLGSESGARFLVSQLEKQLDGQLQVGTVEGRLLDRLELRDVRFSFPFGRGGFSRFVLDWKTTDLLHLQLHILEIAADDISYTLLPTESEAPSTEPFVLPELSLPVSISLEKLAVANLQFFSASEVSPLVIDSAFLALLWDESGIQLQDLQVRMPEGTAAVQGELNPVAGYPLKLQADIVSLMTDLPSIKLHGDFSGDLKRLLVQLTVQGDIAAELNATVNDVINKSSWQGKLGVSDLRPALFAPDIPGVVSGKIETQGNLQQASLTALLAMHDEENGAYNWNADLDMQADLQDLLFTVNHLLLSHDRTNAALELSGTASVDQELDLLLNLHDLQWPLQGTPDFAVSAGTITLKGTVDDYLLNLTADLGGAQLPAGSWLLKAKGSTERAEIMDLQGNVLDGTLGLSGDVQWTPQLQWNLKSQAQGINPEELSGEWPGKFDWLLQSEGRLEEEGVSAEVSLESLQGTLREQPLFGSAELSVSSDSIDIQKLQLGSGSAEIAAKGRLGESSEIDWNLVVPALGDLLPHASGILRGSGTVKGAMDEPRLNVQLTAESASFAEAELKDLQLAADLDLSWQNPFSVSLSTQGLQYEGNGVEDLQVNAAGSREKHTVLLSAVHELASLHLSLAGGYDEVWQGVIKKFKVDSRDLGAWRLRKTAALTVGAEAAQLETMCLEGEGSLCLGGSWDGYSGQSKAEVQLNGFALAALAPWYPEKLQEVGGIFSLQAMVAMQEEIDADVTAKITPGEIRYRTDSELFRTVHHEGGAFTAHVAGGAVESDFHFSLEGNELKGEATLPDVLKVAEKGDAAITARLFVTAHELDVLEALVPDIQELEGGIELDFTVDGTLKEPGLRGKGHLDIGNVFIPAAGLELKDTVFTMAAADKELSLSGTLYSPGGKLILSGTAELDAARNWPAEFSLQADTFRLVNLPEIKIFLDSDLSFTRKGEESLLTGTLAIPKAAVLIRELAPGSQDVSPDVVIIQERKEEPEKVTSPVTMDLKVSLGNDVHFIGFGLNSFVDGQLSLTANPGEQMLGSGEFHVKQGTFRAYGQDLDIERGVISFPGGPLSQPGINLQATRTVGDIVAGVNVLGSASRPRITTFSRPPMSESSTISYLLTGSAPEGGNGGVKLSTGRQINNRLSVFVGTDVKSGDSEFGARYRLNRKTYVQTTTATNSNAVDLFYTIEVGGIDELVTEVVTEDLNLKNLNVLKETNEREKQ